MPHALNGNARLIISVDVEDWPQSTLDDTLDITERAVRNTDRVLEILALHNTKATMFVLGKMAEKFPDVVKRIARAGHEVGSHGHSHVQVFRQTPAEFEQDIQRSKRFLEDLIGQPVLGYRAPCFSIIPETIWALDILASAGFRYDSSIVPVKMPRYGIAGWPLHPARVSLPSGRSIVELPIATLNKFGRLWLVGGGGYHRLFPWAIIKRAISAHAKTGQPFVAYCHPYEFDPDEFAALDLEISLKMRLHQGLGRKGFRGKFERILRTCNVSHASAVALDSPWPDFSIQTLGLNPARPAA